MKVVVYGASGHGKVVADIVLAAGQTVVGFADDRRTEGTAVGLPILGSGEWLTQHRGEFDGVALGIGANDARAKVMERLLAANIKVIAAVHPTTVVARGAKIADGCAVMAGALINPDAVIERGAIINTGAIVEHDCRVGEFAHISPNATLAGTVTIGAFTHIGAGATVINNVNVGSGTVVGAGSVVISDIGSNVVAYGVPARLARENK